MIQPQFERLGRPIRLLLSWLGQYEFATLVLIAACAGGVWTFSELADEVFEGDTQSFDRTLLLTFREASDVTDPIGPRWVEEIGRDVTALGGVAMLLSITVTVATFLWLSERQWIAVFLFCAVSSGMLLSTTLKYAFDRPRPDLVPHGSYVYTRSFPSGHSAMAATTYLTLGALLARVQKQRRLKAFLLLVAGTMTFAVGVSRVYLGVHWPTDVLAGWTMGATWAAACWLIFRWYHAKRYHLAFEREGSISSG